MVIIINSITSIIFLIILNNQDQSLSEYSDASHSGDSSVNDSGVVIQHQHQHQHRLQYKKNNLYAQVLLNIQDQPRPQCWESNHSLELKTL